MVVMCVSVVFHRCAVSISAALSRRFTSTSIKANSIKERRFKSLSLMILMNSCFEKNGNTLLQKNSLKIVIRRFINLTLYQIEKPIRNVGNHKSFDSFTEFQIDNENSNLCIF
jgi:hypothetical protein